MNDPHGGRDRALSGLLFIVVVCVGVRVAAELVAPLLPGLLALAALVIVVSFLFRGPHIRR